MKEHLAFGEPGVDDLPIDPTAISRLESGHRYVLLLEGEDDPAEGVRWPIVRGDRIIFATYDEEAGRTAIAVAHEEYGNDPAVLGEVASHETQDASSVRVIVETDGAKSGSPPRAEATLRDAAMIACRVVALYVPLRLLESLQGGRAGALFSSERGPQRTANVVSLILFLAVGVFLWQNAWRVADAIVPFQRRAARATTGGARDLQALIFSVVGLFLVAGGLPELITLAFGLLSNPVQNETMGGISPVRSFYIPQLIGTILRLIIGIWLLLGSKQIILWIQRRRPSYNSTEDPEIRWAPEEGES